MQTDDLENQISTYSTILSYRYFPAQTRYRHLTMPTHEHGNCSKGVVKGGLLSKSPTSSQLYMEQAITSPIPVPSLNSPVRTYQNGHSNQLMNSTGFLTNTHSPALAIETVPSGNPGMNISGWGLFDQETRRLSVVKSTTQHRNTFSDFYHLVGYIVGATTIFSLYMIIPLMILLNATLPDNWNKLLIALGILALAELVICIILIKTIPRGKSKSKKENVLVQL